ncbi:MAG: orotate phosphoribosyltransferase [Chitinophagaceae bacterium]|nr:MAG: orotate phosphoribosyltransferase [Chitinophagaceae bacterium]
MSDIEKKEKEIAAELLKIKAVELSVNKPFIWASGLKSPIYCDNRKTLAYPELREMIAKNFSEIIQSSESSPDVIAGVATGGIAHGLLVAEKLQLPFCYVRPEPKGHGLKNQIEGELKEGKKVFVIEDLVSTGKSSFNAVKALLESGADVVGLASIFTYGFNDAGELFKKAGIPYYSLTNYDILLRVATTMNYLTETDAAYLKKWKDNPKEW